jgi:hypothetical protein
LQGRGRKITFHVCSDDARRLDHGSLAVDPKTWSLDWPNPSAGEHTVTSPAISAAGQIQPAMDDPLIAKKHILEKQ